MADSQHQPAFDLDDTGSNSKAAADMMLHEMPASDLRLHPRLGCTIDELRRRYATALERETDCLQRKAPPAGLPRVMAIDGTGQLGAVTDIPTAIAAIDLAARGVAITLTVIEVGDFSGEAFVREMLVPTMGRSLWEQASALEFLRAEYGSLREWMRASALDPERWDSKCSKIVKILGLPEAIREKIDLFSIKNAKDAGDIATLWSDADKREALTAILQTETALCNDRVPAGPLFKKMLAGVSRSVPRAAWTERGDRKVLVDRSGRTIATMTVDELGWTLEGDYHVEGDWRVVAGALKEL